MLKESLHYSQLNMANTRHKFSTRNKVSRVIWLGTYFLLFRPFGLRVFKKWRIFLLRIFGGDISYKSMVNSSVKIWAPWNLTMGDFSCLGPNVDCYNQGHITIENNVTISQKAYLCSSSHDYSKATHDLLLKPILIKERAWVGADAFIGPGVTVGGGAIVGARSAVFKNVDDWTVVGGNPAKFIKTRIID